MRLGDLDALLDEIGSLTLTISGVRNGKSVIREILVKYRDAVLREIVDAPTIDAVPVVRCRDCKHFSRFQNTNWCEVFDDGYYSPDDNDFCSRGTKSGE